MQHDRVVLIPQILGIAFARLRAEGNEKKIEHIAPPPGDRVARVDVKFTGSTGGDRNCKSNPHGNSRGGD